MLDGLVTLLSLSTVMAIASFLAGLLPLSLTLSQSQLRLISTLGMGVLVGTSLIVIIPEGVETLYSATEEVAHAHKRSNVIGSPIDVRWNAADIHKLPNLETSEGRAEPIDAVDTLPVPVIPGEIPVEAQGDNTEPSKTPTTPGVVGALNSDTVSENAQASEKPQREPHAWIGVSLILGFILMYLIDILPSLKPPQPTQRMNIYSLSDLSSNAPAAPSKPDSKGSFSTTLGLVIHAAADGIALGASSTIPSISFIIFFAIMIHKAPAAFGLTSILLKQGLGKRRARAHLVAFSSAAPTGAIITWFLVRLLGGGGEGAGTSGAESMKFWTGVILLFSGGTFLYVAMHTMQENDASHATEEVHSNGFLDGSHERNQSRSESKKNLQLVAAAVVGMLLPLVTQIGHAH